MANFHGEDFIRSCGLEGIAMLGFKETSAAPLSTKSPTRIKVAGCDGVVFGGVSHILQYTTSTIMAAK